MSLLEAEFAVFRDQVIGREQTFLSPYGEQRILYADWTASGRAYTAYRNLPARTYITLLPPIPIPVRPKPAPSFRGPMKKPRRHQKSCPCQIAGRCAAIFAAAA
jgi:hypothetical protein